MEGFVPLTAAQRAASAIALVEIGRGGGQEHRLIGRVESPVNARTYIAAAVGGRIARIHIASGVTVKAGQPLLDLVSADAAALRAQADAAQAEAHAAALAYRRDLNLVEQGVVARQEMEASQARSQAANAAARAANAQVAAVGNPDATGRIVMTSPTAGIVGTIQAAPGSWVASGAPLTEIADPGLAELVFTAPPSLASAIRVGAPLHVSTASGKLDAEVLGVSVNVRERNGATLVRARPRIGQPPPPGSAVEAIIITDRQADVMTVPVDAVQTVEGQSVVFVDTAEGFQATPVLLGRKAGDQLEVLSGLSGSERIAGRNAFLLKAELAKGEADHAH